MKKNILLAYWLLRCALPVVAQTQTITILDEYGDTLKPLLVRYKLGHEQTFKDCKNCTAESGIINLSKLERGTYTFKLRLDDGLPSIERSIEIPLEKDTIMVSVSPKSIFESGEPSQIITAEQLMLSGKNTLEEALVYLLPSFYASWQIMADKSEFFTPTSMKGMSPDQFLVLINGKRRHATSVLHLNGTFGRGTVSNDLVNIPMSAVKAIEVKNAAASVWHGSDAIAGVINIQLHDKPIPTTFGVQMGGYPSGFGQPDDNGNGQWWTKNGAGNEKEGKIYWQSFHYLGKDKKGFLSLGGDWIHLGHINRTGNYNGTYFTDSLQNTNEPAVKGFWNEMRDVSGFARDKVILNGRAEIQQASAYFNLETPIHHAYFYAFGGFTYKTGDIVGFYRFPKDIGKVNLSETPNGYSPHLNPKTSDFYWTTGLKWNLRGLGNLDVAYSTGGHAVHNYLNNSFNVDLSYTPPFTSKDTISPRDFYAGANFYRQQTIDIQLHKFIPVKKGASHVELTSGILLRAETFGTVAGEEAAYYYTPNDPNPKNEGSTQKLPSFHPDDAVERDRNNYGAFLQGKLAYRIHEQLSGHLTAGGRYETFSNFQGKPILKGAAGLIYSDDKKEGDLHLSWNQGFRTPSLHQIYFTGVSSQYRGASANLVYIGSNESVLARAIGVKPLQPESANSWNIGGSWRNTSKSNPLEFKIDYSKTIVENRIVLSAFFDDTARFFAISKNLNINLKDRNVTSALFFLNYPTTTTHSMDVSFQWKLNPAFQLLLGGNWNRTRVSANTDLTLNKVFERQEISRYEEVIPAGKGFILLHGQSEKMTYKFQTTFFGQNRFVAPEDPIKSVDSSKIKYTDQVFKNQYQPIIDIEFGYYVFSKSKLTIGCTNLLGFKSNQIEKWEAVKAKLLAGNATATDAEKKAWIENITNNGALNYSRRVQTFGVGGAFIYAKWTYHFY